jgi:methyl-accepting chemotaxis protein
MLRALKTLKARFLLNCMLVFTVSLIFAAGSVYSIATFREDVSQSTTIATALRNHTNGDMMHDALRGDVLSALAKDEIDTQKEDVLKDYKEHSDLFLELIDQNKQLPLSQEVREALSSVEEPLKNYIKEAGHIINLSYRDKEAAIKAYPNFLEAFEALEESMEIVGDKVEAASKVIETETNQFGEMAAQVSWVLAAISIGSVFTLFAFAIFGVINPLKRIENTMTELTGNNTEIEIPYLKRMDELGSMAKSIETFREAIIERNMSEKARVEEERVVERQRQAVMVHMAEAIELETSSGAKHINEEAANLRGQIGSMQNDLATVATASVEISEQAQTSRVMTQEAANLSQQVIVAIGEIAGQVNRGSQLTQDAVSRANASRETMNALTKAAADISDIVGVISSIADQTNLLALNATIEAARAGEAGKGFAVVASEVKSLATQTGRSTEEISNKVAEIQAVARTAAETLSNIGEAIDQLNEVTTAISAAMEEQRAATEGFSMSVNETNQMVSQLAERMGDIAGMVNNSSTTAGEVASMAVELIDTSDKLLSRLPEIVNQAMRKVDKREHDRFEGSASVSVIINGQASRLDIVDLSQGGARLPMIPGANEGDKVQVMFPGGEKLSANVAWVGGGQTGLKFAPYHLEQTGVMKYAKKDALAA